MKKDDNRQREAPVNVQQLIAEEGWPAEQVISHLLCFIAEQGLLPELFVDLKQIRPRFVVRYTAGGLAFSASSREACEGWIAGAVRYSDRDLDSNDFLIEDRQ